MSLIPFRLLSFPVVAILGQILWMNFFEPTDWLPASVAMVVLSYCWFCIGGIAHEMVHDNLHLGRRGVWVARLMGALLLIPHSVYREVHMRHHAYLNTPLDWEMWPYSDPHTSITFRRIFVVFDVLLAVFVTPIVWGRICFSKYSPVSAEVKKTMKREYAACGIVWFSVVAGCIWLHETGRFTFRAEHLIFAAPPLLATMLNGCRKLMDHVGTESIDPVHGTRTIVGQSYVTRILSFFNFDLAIHGPHHRFPKLDHSQLEQKMNSLQEENPEAAYPVYSSFSAAIFDTVKRVMVTPGVGLNAGFKGDLSHLPMNQSACGPFNSQPQ